MVCISPHTNVSQIAPPLPPPLPLPPPTNLLPRAPPDSHIETRGNILVVEKVRVLWILTLVSSLTLRHLQLLLYLLSLINNWVELMERRVGWNLARGFDHEKSAASDRLRQ